MRCDVSQAALPGVAALVRHRAEFVLAWRALRESLRVLRQAWSSQVLTGLFAIGLALLTVGLFHAWWRSEVANANARDALRENEKLKERVATLELDAGIDSSIDTWRKHGNGG